MVARLGLGALATPIMTVLLTWPALAATSTTFNVSAYVFPPFFVGSNIPAPLGTVTIDTDAGRVVAHTIRSDYPDLPQTAEQHFDSIAAAWIYSFSVQPSAALKYTYTLYFPVPSLVGYAGGQLGRFLDHGAGPEFDLTTPFLAATFLDPATGAAVGGETQEFLRAGSVVPTTVPEPGSAALVVAALGIVAWPKSNGRRT